MRKQIMNSIRPIHIYIYIYMCMYIICCHKLSILYVLLVVEVHPKQHCWKKKLKTFVANSKCFGKKFTNFLYMVQIGGQENGFFPSYFVNSQIWLNWQDSFTPQLYHKIENKNFWSQNSIFFLMNHFDWPITNEF
jgi:hypothetical protein